MHAVTNLILWTSQWTSRMMRFMLWTNQWTSRIQSQAYINKTDDIIDAYSGTLCSWQYCPSWFPWPDVLESRPCRLELEVILESYCSRLSRLSMLLTRNSFRNPLKSRSSVSACAAQCQCTPHAQRFTPWMHLHHTVRWTENITATDKDKHMIQQPNQLSCELTADLAVMWQLLTRCCKHGQPFVIACWYAMACIWWNTHTPTSIWEAWPTHLHSQLPWGHLRLHAQLPQLAA